LESDRPEVVREAMRWSPNCWDKERKPEVHARLRTIFEGKNEDLKLRACFSLMHDFKDKEAIAYLLKETRSENRGRALLAVGWIGDSCNSRTPVYPELLEALEPYLTSDDDRMRRHAVWAIGTYQGEAAIRHLIAALADANGAVVHDARIGLVHTQRDGDTVARLVNEALEQETRADVEQRLREVLDGIEKKKKQMKESR
jgi:HEAT repeat protein